MPTPLRLLTPILLILPSLAFAAEAFRCTARDGSVSFQDRPCSGSLQQEQLKLQGYAPPQVDELPADTVPTPTRRAKAAEAPAARTQAAAAAEPPPSFFLCTRFDGSEYASDIGIGGTAWVPYGAVAPNRSLARTYGPGGAGVSAPGVSEPTQVAASGASTHYVQVDDECRRLQPLQACQWLRRELERAQTRLKESFSDTRAEREREVIQLNERLRGC